MSDNYLISVVETWRVPNDGAAKELESEFRKTGNYELIKWAKQDKAIKEKKEIVETYVEVKATKVFNNVKAPDSDVRPDYR